MGCLYKKREVRGVPMPTFESSKKSGTGQVAVAHVHGPILLSLLYLGQRRVTAILSLSKDNPTF